MRTWPFVTIAMPCLDEAAFIEACLDGVRRQDYPGDRIEILVADGGSTDGTQAILERLCAEDPRIQMVGNPQRLQAAGMNAMIRRARGDVIVRMDVHSDYAQDYVRRCIEVLDRTGADNVGGAPRVRGRTTFQRAVCAALRSPLGVGGAPNWSEKNEGEVDSVFNGAFRRRVFETAGLYDPRAVTNEDAELNQRLRAAGGRIYLSRDVVVHYYPRASLPSLVRQYFRYGQGRARTLLKHRRLLSPRPLIPFLMVSGGLALVLVPWLWPLAPWAFGAYALAVVAEAVRVSRGDSLALAPLVAVVFPAFHVSHGVGMMHGLLRYKVRPDWGETERLPGRATGEIGGEAGRPP